MDPLFSLLEVDWGQLLALGEQALQVVAAPAVGALIALAGVFVGQRMHRTTQERAERRAEIRNMAAQLLQLAGLLWTRGWELYQATQESRSTLDDSARIKAMNAENEVHGEALAAQRRLALTTPKLDDVSLRLIDTARIWPPPMERLTQEATQQRDGAEAAFIEAVRKELDTK